MLEPLRRHSRPIAELLLAVMLLQPLLSVCLTGQSAGLVVVLCTAQGLEQVQLGGSMGAPDEPSAELGATQCPACFYQDLLSTGAEDRGALALAAPSTVPSAGELPSPARRGLTAERPPIRAPPIA